MSDDRTQALLDTYADIMDLYDAPERHYHNRDHVLDVIETSLDLCDATDRHTRDVLVLSAIFHDAIYDPARDDNERRSADLAVRRIDDYGIASKVERIVLATKDHSHPCDRITACFLDADLAILAADPQRYDTYACAIRREYEMFPDAQYAVGRVLVLRSLLSGQIYATDGAREQWTSAARENVEREIASLESR